MDKRMWKLCAERYLVPNLPEGWSISGNLLYIRQNEWIVCALHPNHYEGASWFKVERLVQFMAIPRNYLWGPLYESLAHQTSNGVPVIPANADDAAPVMGEVLESIKSEALPYFAKAGTANGLLETLEELSGKSPLHLGYLEMICYLQTILERNTDARSTATKILQSQEQHNSPDVIDLLNRVRQVSQLAAEDPASAKHLLRDWATESWLAISRP